MIFLVYLFIIDKTGDLFYFFLQSYWCLALGSFIEKKSLKHFKLHTSEKSTKTRTTRYVFETHKMVSFNIARTTYILSGQKLIKKAQNGQFWRGFKKILIFFKQGEQEENRKM